MKISNVIETELQQAGNYSQEFDGSKLPAGIYIFELIFGNEKKSVRMIKIK